MMTGLRLRMRDELEQRYNKLRLDALNSATYPALKAKGTAQKIRKPR